MTVDFSIVWGSYFISVPLILASVWAGTKYLSKKYVDQKFARNLESHKHDLQNIIELNKFDIQRKMQDFNLYTTKKHEAYTNLFRLFLEADGFIGRLMGTMQTVEYWKYSHQEISKMLEEYNIGEMDREEILEKWIDGSSNGPVEIELRSLMNKAYINAAKENHTKAHSEYFFSKLYLSEEVDEICSELTKTLKKLCLSMEGYWTRSNNTNARNALFMEIKADNQKIDSLLRNLKNTMQKELSIGYYN